MWDLILNWSDLAERGADALTYAVLAVVGTLLFVIRLALALFGGCPMAAISTSTETWAPMARLPSFRS